MNREENYLEVNDYLERSSRLNGSAWRTAPLSFLQYQSFKNML